MEIKNDGRLKICWMRIVGYQQFQDVFLDFTHPETGEPLDKICLIGANGTGKTVVLEVISSLLSRQRFLRHGQPEVSFEEMMRGSISHSFSGSYPDSILSSGVGRQRRI